jgi:hypothetical protein
MDMATIDLMSYGVELHYPFLPLSILLLFSFFIMGTLIF